MDFFIVGLGGFFGAIARYSFNLIEKSFRPHLFPFVTLLINTLGCFLAGILLFWMEKKLPEYRSFILLISVGFLGSYTTFSTFSVDTFQLLRSGHLSLALINIVGSILLGLLAVWLGSRVC